MLEADMLKNVVLHSVATALASNVFPVPMQKTNINLIISLAFYTAPNGKQYVFKLIKRKTLKHVMGNIMT